MGKEKKDKMPTKMRVQKRRRKDNDHVFFVPFSKPQPPVPEGTKLLPLFATGKNPSWA